MKDRHNVATLDTVTGVLTTTVTTIAVMATGIIIFVANDSNQTFMLQLKQEDDKPTDSLTRALMVFG